jgi:hypothetical protein
MVRSSWSRSAPVVVLAGLLLVGCASSGKKQVSPAEQLHAAIEETIVEQERRAEMLALSDQYLEILDQLVEELGAGRESLDRLVADYGSDRESFEAFFAEYADRRAELSERAIEIHLAMKEIASDEEWRSLEKAAQRVTTTMLSESVATVSD